MLRDSEFTYGPVSTADCRSSSNLLFFESFRPLRALKLNIGAGFAGFAMLVKWLEMVRKGSKMVRCYGSGSGLFKGLNKRAFFICKQWKCTNDRNARSVCNGLQLKARERSRGVRGIELEE